MNRGDTVTMVTAIRRGDIVAIERVGPTDVQVRALTPEEQERHAGVLHRVDRTPDGQISCTPLDRPDRA